MRETGTEGRKEHVQVGSATDKRAVKNYDRDSTAVVSAEQRNYRKPYVLKQLGRMLLPLADLREDCSKLMRKADTVPGR